MLSRRLPCLFAAAVLSVAGGALADPEADKPAAGALDAAFGATILSTYPDGRQARLWLHKGGDYTAKGRRGDPSSGRWTIKGDKLCLKQRRPFPAPFSFCTPTHAGGLGTTWTAKAFTGETVQVKLVEGAG